MQIIEIAKQELCFSVMYQSQNVPQANPASI